MLEQIGLDYKITKERVRQIEERALEEVALLLQRSDKNSGSDEPVKVKSIDLQNMRKSRVNKNRK